MWNKHVILHLYSQTEDDLLIAFDYVIPVFISYHFFLGIIECSTKRVAMDCVCFQDKKAIPIYSDTVRKCFNYADERSSCNENDCLGSRRSSPYLAPIEPPLPRSLWDSRSPDFQNSASLKLLVFFYIVVKYCFLF